MPTKPILQAQVLRPGASKGQLELTIVGVGLMELVNLLQDYARDFKDDPDARFVVHRIHGSPTVSLSITPTRAGAE
jgi:hypothetical protein